MSRVLRGVSRRPGARPRAAEPPPALGRRDWLIALVLLVLCAWAYYRAPVQQLLDWRYSTAVSHSLLHEGSFSVPRELLEHRQYQLLEIDGRAYHGYPMAPAVLNVPLVAAAELFGVSIFDAEGYFDREAELWVLRVGAALVTAATVALLFLVARLDLGRRWAVALALAFAFGTSLLSSASRPYWSHAWAVFFLALGLHCILAPAARRRWLRDAAGATALSWAFFCRPPLAISVVALTLLVVVENRRRLVSLVLMGSAWAALYVAHSMWIFRQPLPPYFEGQAATGVTVENAVGFSLEAALGGLVSPARGLFFYSPMLLVILLAVVREWRALDRRRRRVAVVASGAIVAHWHLLGSTGGWAGGSQFGPRLFTDILPWFVVLGSIATAAVLARVAADGRRAGLGWAAAAVVTLLVSFFIHYQGAANRLTTRHWGLWNWRFPPFMVGVIPYPGSPVPGAQLVYSAGLDNYSSDGWTNSARRWGFDLEMADGIGYRRLPTAGRAEWGALRFVGSGGGTTRPLQDLGGEPNVTTDDATFEIWFRPAPAGDRRQVLFETGGTESGITVYVEAGRPGVEVRDGGAATSTRLVSPRAVSRGELSQLAVLLGSGETGFELALYVNAEPVAGPVVAPGIRDWAGGNGSGLGTAANRPSLAAGDFHGEIALFRFYPVRLERKHLRRNLRAAPSR